MPDYSKLTKRQKEIFEFIRSKIETRGYGPTVREIGDHFAIRSPNGVMCHLRALVAKGIITREKQSARAIQLVDFRPPSFGLPLLGSVAAGAPLEAIENAERIDLDEMFSGPDRFALKVRGESMIEDHIEDGDLVVIKQQRNASNGERVVVLVDNEATLKKYYRENDQIRLEPANGSMKPIIVKKDQTPEILGVLVGVVRKC